MYKKILIIFLTASLLFCYSCSNGNFNNSSDTTSIDDAELNPLPECVEYPQKELQPVSFFDRQMVYEHVFENQSILLSDDDEIEPDPTKKEGLVSFELTWSVDGTEYKSKDTYFVKGVSSENSNNCSKYTAFFNEYYALSPLGLYATVTHDYYETYLDVLFESLTFSLCEKLPTREDGYYEVGHFAEKVTEDTTFHFVNNRYFYTDGYMYYIVCDKEGVPTNYYKSDVKVDIAYLSFIVFNSSVHKDNLETIHRYGLETHFNMNIVPKEPSEIISWTDEMTNEVTQAIKDANGTCLRGSKADELWERYVREGDGYGLTCFVISWQMTFYDMRGLKY